MNDSEIIEQSNKTTTPVKPKHRTYGPVSHLPKWKVILHNDDINDALDVAKSVHRITQMDKFEAARKTQEAHESGIAFLLATHQERAELYRDQFAFCKPHPITVTIELDA